ncbi:MAG: hypothetical protein U0638_05495 [Phycisphaerales bacterium]
MSTSWRSDRWIERRALRVLLWLRDQMAGVVLLSGLLMIATVALPWVPVVFKDKCNPDLINPWLIICPTALTALGLLYALATIEAHVNRPVDFVDILQRARLLLDQSAQYQEPVVLIMGEYPLWGALHGELSDEVKKYSDSIEKSLRENLNSRLAIVGPLHSKTADVMPSGQDVDGIPYMNDYIRDYATRYRLDARAGETALDSFLGVLCESSKSRMRHWRVAPPRYQAMVAGEIRRDNGRMVVVPQRGIIWMALLSSEMLIATEENPKSATGAAGASHQSRVGMSPGVPVEVVAWDVSNRKHLDAILDAACQLVPRTADGATVTRNELFGLGAA